MFILLVINLLSSVGCPEVNRLIHQLSKSFAEFGKPQFRIVMVSLHKINRSDFYSLNLIP